MLKSMMMGCEGHVTGMSEVRNSYTFFVGKPRRRLEVNIKIYTHEVVWEGVE
jgi:hypothetical protein